LIDACAYIGSIIIFFIKNYFAGFDIVLFVEGVGYALVVANILLLIISSWYFHKKISMIEKG
jgi:hypothetical protein